MNNLIKNIYISVKYQNLSDWYFHSFFEDKYYYTFLLIFHLFFILILLIKYYIWIDLNQYNLFIWLLILNIIFLIFDLFFIIKHNKWKWLFEEIKTININDDKIKKDILDTAEEQKDNTMLWSWDYYLLLYIIIASAILFLNKNIFSIYWFMLVVILLIYIFLRIIYAKLYITDIELENINLSKKDKDNIADNIYNDYIGFISNAHFLYLSIVKNKKNKLLKIDKIKKKDIKYRKWFDSYLKQKKKNVPIIPLLYIIIFAILIIILIKL